MRELRRRSINAAQGMPLLRTALAWKRRIRPVKPVSADWYDEKYASSDVYAAHYSDSPYMIVWEALAARISEPRRVLEVGCGSGQLAHLLADRELLADYVGFDLSPVAIASARARCPQLRFEVADAFTTDLFDVDYDLVICTEVLEHVDDDRGLLRRIRPGTQVLATVPDFISETHVRWFPKAQNAASRYGSDLENLEVLAQTHDSGWTIFIVDGTVRAQSARSPA